VKPDYGFRKDEDYSEEKKSAVEQASDIKQNLDRADHMVK